MRWWAALAALIMGIEPLMILAFLVICEIDGEWKAKEKAKKP